MSLRSGRRQFPSSGPRKLCGIERSEALRPRPEREARLLPLARSDAAPPRARSGHRPSPRAPTPLLPEPALTHLILPSRALSFFLAHGSRNPSHSHRSSPPLDTSPSSDEQRRSSASPSSTAPPKESSREPAVHCPRPLLHRPRPKLTAGDSGDHLV